MLPPSLEMKYTDIDDELAVSLGRARLASMTAIGLMIDKGTISPQEGRLQLLSDGLLSISIPEELPEDAVPQNQNPTGERPGLLGKPISPSQGGYGEIKAELFDSLMEDSQEFRSVVEEIEQRWDSFDLNTKDEIVKEINTMLDAIPIEA